MLSRAMLSAVVCVCGIVAAPGSVVAQHWSAELPAGVQDSIIWYAGHETGSLYEWTYAPDEGPDNPNAGGGVFNTGGDDVEAAADSAVAHRGQWSARTTITNAYRAQNGNRAVRLMRWTDRPWDAEPVGGDFLGDENYFSVWMYFPTVYNPNKYQPWDPGDGGWWNVFQFKSDDDTYTSQPVWVLNIAHNDDDGTMYFYMYSNYNPPYSYEQPEPMVVPAGRWVHVEAYLYSATGSNGHITIWQNGRRIFDIGGVTTSLGGATGDETYPIWGIGNYTDHIAGDTPEGTATVYFDDALISSQPVHEYACSPADLSGDCMVHFDDYELFATQWVRSDCTQPDWCEGADLNTDGRVDTYDYAVLVEAWRQQG